MLHVNGDDADAVAALLRQGRVLRYRERFHKDVVIDLVCYRLHGHNEGDDPSYTQPLIYEMIEHHPDGSPDLRGDTLARRGVVTPDECRRGLRLRGDRPSSPRHCRPWCAGRDPPSAISIARSPSAGRARISAARARPSGQSTPRCSTRIAERLHHGAVRGFHRAPEARPPARPACASSTAQGDIDWATAEALAFGSFLLEGTDIRLSGQDSRRGTFSHRHAVLVDYETAADFAPLAALADTEVGGLAADRTTRASTAGSTVYRLGAHRVRGARVRVRLLACEHPGRAARAQGGAVRGLLERRADRHRQLRHLR